MPENKNNQELEYEAKGLLTETHYLLLLSHFNLKKEQAKKQTNSFFDNRDWGLNEKSITLRIRTKEGETELTLKEKAPGGRLETNHRPLTPEEEQNFRKTGLPPEGNVRNKLKLLNVLPPYPYQGDSITHRIEIPYKGCKMALDYTSYLGKVDYEIEMQRVDTAADENIILLELLKELQIPYAPGKSKRKRFFKAKKAQFRLGEVI